MHVNVGGPSDGLHLVRRTSRRRGIHESGSEGKFKKMSAFGDVIGRMSNGPGVSGLVL